MLDIMSVFKSMISFCPASYVSQPGPQQADDEDKIDYGGSNVHVITSKEDWDQKIEEANKDGKIVSKTYSRS